MNIFRYLNLTSVLIILVSCSEDRFDVPEISTNGNNSITLTAAIEQVNISRVNDSGFADGDAIGVYIANYPSSGNPASLALQGNAGDNLKFTLDGDRWIPDHPTYWNAEYADFYGYYPYQDNVTSVSAMPFSIESDQSEENIKNGLGGYEASDFLWAKSTKTQCKTQAQLKFTHIMAGVQVTLVAGENFSSDEWASLEKTVLVENTLRHTTINLATGEVSLTSTQQNNNEVIIAAGYNDKFRAIVAPQTISAGKTLLSISVGGQSYSFSRQEDMIYYPSKLHKFTIRVDARKPQGDYKFTLIAEAITAWENDLISHNGKAKEYAIVNMLGPGQMEQSLKVAGIDPKTVTNLKVIGEMNTWDYYFLRDSVPLLEALNLKDVLSGEIWVGGPETDDRKPYQKNSIPTAAFGNKGSLKNIVFPDKLLAIGDYAFCGTPLSGNLYLPEGLTYIGDYSFANYLVVADATSALPGGAPKYHNNFTGELFIPTTVLMIGKLAFCDCNFTGELSFSQNLKSIGEKAFYNCKNISGSLHLPNSITELGDGAFAGMSGISGSLIIPDAITEIRSFITGLNISSVGFSDKVTIIHDNAFNETKLRGDIVLPVSIQSIGSYAYQGTEISHITFPVNLMTLSRNAFSNCCKLQDTIIIPNNIEVIESMTFYNCQLLNAIVLPKKLSKIRSKAFENCYSLNYIYCQATIPPVIENESAFNGVAKDNFTLVVPEGCVDAYRNAPIWNDFRRIATYRDFVTRPSKFNTLNTGGSRNIILNADGPWSVTHCPSWAKIDKTSGSQKTELRISVDPMAKGSGIRADSIVFQLTGDSEKHTTHINLSQYDYEHDEDSYVQLQNASKGNGVDIFIVGDGYDAADIASGNYLRDVRQHMEYFFGVEPYTTYRDYFNVYTAIARSEDSGIGSTNRLRDTKFNMNMGDCQTRLTGNGMAVLDYCASNVAPISAKPSPTVLCICIANDDGCDGITMLFGESNVSFVTNSNLSYPNDARGVTQHEAGGHGFGLLGDEYIYHSDFIQHCHCNCPNYGCSHVKELQDMHAKGFARNISLNGKYREEEWSHLIFDPRYSDIVDLYEGGFFHSRGVYRSEYNSCMNNSIPYFSTWCRQLIVERIMRLAGETFNFETFVSLDKRTMGRDFTTSRSGVPSNSRSPRHNAPVFKDGYTFGKNKSSKKR